MEKLKELVEKELKSMEESGIDSSNIDVIYKLVDIHKDIENEEYWKVKKEAMEGVEEIVVADTWQVDVMEAVVEAMDTTCLILKCIWIE